MDVEPQTKLEVPGVSAMASWTPPESGAKAVGEFIAVRQISHLDGEVCLLGVTFKEEALKEKKVDVNQDGFAMMLLRVFQMPKRVCRIRISRMAEEGRSLIPGAVGFTEMISSIRYCGVLVSESDALIKSLRKSRSNE